jgi:hypothetical protein
LKEWLDWKLRDAVWENHAGMVRILLALGANTDLNSVDGTPLHIAIQQRHDSLIKMLIRAGADTNTKNAEGNTPLHNAAFYCSTEAAFAAIIRSDAGVNAENNKGETPLHIAVYRAAMELTARNSRVGLRMVELLVRAGSDLEALNDSGQTPLDVAAKGGQESVANLLLELGAVEPADFSTKMLKGKAEAEKFRAYLASDREREGELRRRNEEQAREQARLREASSANKKQEEEKEAAAIRRWRSEGFSQLTVCTWNNRSGALRVLSESCTSQEARRIAQEWGAGLSVRTVSARNAPVSERFSPWFLDQHLGVRVAFGYKECYVGREQWDDGGPTKSRLFFCILRIGADSFKCIEFYSYPY